MNNNKSSSGGITFSGLLTVVFIVLKLMKVISWKWIWVISPICISILLGIVIYVIAYMYYDRNY